MDELSYDKIRSLLQIECNDALCMIRQFPEYRGIYAFCIDLDPGNGSFRISWNTESAFAQTASRYIGKHGHTYEDLYQFFWGTKYNSGDFTFHLDQFRKSGSVLSEVDNLFASHSEFCYHLSEASDQNDQRIEALNQKLIDQAVWAINHLDFGGIDRTNDFIAFVTLHDADDATLLNLLGRTVASSILENLPPRIEWLWQP